jgi:hypothetical protein
MLRGKFALIFTYLPYPQKFNKLLVDSRLIGRLHDDRFAMVAGSLFRIAMINAKQGERHAP